MTNSKKKGWQPFRNYEFILIATNYLRYLYMGHKFEHCCICHEI